MGRLLSVVLVFLAIPGCYSYPWYQPMPLYGDRYFESVPQDVSSYQVQATPRTYAPDRSNCLVYEVCLENTGNEVTPASTQGAKQKPCRRAELCIDRFGNITGGILADPPQPWGPRPPG